MPNKICFSKPNYLSELNLNNNKYKCEMYLLWEDLTGNYIFTCKSIIDNLEKKNATGESLNSETK